MLRQVALGLRNLGIVAFVAVALVGCGCGGSDKSPLDTAAPPPGPNANLNPPTKASMIKKFKQTQPSGTPSAPGGSIPAGAPPGTPTGQ